MDLKLLQIGAPKSGNYWLYNIIQYLFQLKGIEPKSFIQNQPVYMDAQKWDLSNSRQAGIDMIDIQNGKCYYRISSVIREPIDDLSEYVRQSNHVWTHSEVCDNIEPVLRSFNKLIYIYRDPRDMAISASRFAFTPYMQNYYPHEETSFESYLENNLAKIIHDWMWHITDYLLLKEDFPIHFIAFENLLDKFEPTMQRLCEFLEIDLNREERTKLMELVSFHQMKKKDPDHVKKGKRMQWVNVLDDNQKEFVIESAGGLLSLLNYSLDESDSLPADANNLQLNQIEQVAEGLKQVSVRF